MPKIKASSFTPSQAETILDLTNWETNTNSFFDKIKSIDPTIIPDKQFDGKNKASDFEGVNMFELYGGVLRHAHSFVDSIFPKYVEDLIKSPATIKDLNQADFLGFLSSPKLTDGSDENVIKKQLKDLIDMLNSTESKLRNYISESAVKSYVKGMNDVTIDETEIDVNDPINLISKLVKNKEFADKTNYLITIIELFGIQFSVNRFIGKQYVFLIKLFKHDIDIINSLSSNISPFIDNSDSIRNDPDFMSNSINLIFENTNYVEYEKAMELSSTKMPITFEGNNSQINFGLNLVNRYALLLFTVKYLSFYLSLGYSKMFNETIETSDPVTKNAIAANVKTSDTKEKETLDIKTDSSKPQSNSNIDSIKKIQKDSFKALGILQGNPDFNEVTPKHFSDGVIGVKTKKLFGDIKVIINNNKILNDKIKEEKTKDFGKFERSAVAYVIANPNDFKSDHDFKDFLGISDLNIDTKFKDYIMNDLENTPAKDLSTKVSSLYKAQLGKDPSKAEIETALSWLSTYKETNSNTNIDTNGTSSFSNDLA